MIEIMNKLTDLVDSVNGELKLFKDGAINVIMPDGLVIMTPAGRDRTTNMETMIKLINKEKPKSEIKEDKLCK